MWLTINRNSEKGFVWHVFFFVLLPIHFTVTFFVLLALTKISTVECNDLQIVIIDTWEETESPVIILGKQKIGFSFAITTLFACGIGCQFNSLTEVVAVVVPALVSTSLILIQSLFSILVIFLPQVYILQNLIGSVHLQEPLMGRGVTLQQVFS